MPAAGFHGWVPFRFYWRGDEPMVDWCYLGATRFTEPFFEATIDSVIHTPFNSLFRRRTPMAELARWNAECPGLKPAGFIFHMSRCGSTLITQLLASLPQYVVLSEPPPLCSLLQPRLGGPDASAAQKAVWLRWLVSALGQPRIDRNTEVERRVFVKFDPPSIVALPLVRQAFPDVPWIFVYREPAEVIVSNLRVMSPWATPGLLAQLPGIDRALIPSMPEDEYAARAIAMVTELASRYFPDPLGMLVNYTQLPAIVWGELQHHFGMAFSAAEIDGLKRVATFNAKRPKEIFANDSEQKTRDAAGRVRLLADRWIQPHYARLEELRAR